MPMFISRMSSISSRIGSFHTFFFDVEAASWEIDPPIYPYKKIHAKFMQLNLSILVKSTKS